MAFLAAGAVKSARAAKKPAKATGGKAAARRAPAGDPNLERDRAAIQKIKDAREPEPDDTPAPAATVPPPTSPGGGLSLPGMGAAATGSGFLFGVFAWALGLAYLRGGSPEVRRFMAAKFLNKVEGS
jgi:hypothetical protein